MRSAIASFTRLRLRVFQALKTVSTKSARPFRAAAIRSMARSWVPIPVAAGSNGARRASSAGPAMVSTPSGNG
jgi:hypothetical protein